MKMLCIDAEKKSDDYRGDLLVEGCVYTVVEECDGYGTTGKIYQCYFLLEIGDEFCFEKDRFIPLSDIDETELAEQRQDLIYY